MTTERRLALLGLVAALVVGCSESSPPYADEPTEAVPGSLEAAAQPNDGAAQPNEAAAEPTIARGHMAALGDSITLGFGACDRVFVCASRSWSTGWGPDVRTHLTRLHGTDPTFWQATNLAELGATVSDLGDQARRARELDAGYVTVLIGANDACADTLEAMTPVADFEAAVAEALAVLDPDATDTRVFISSIPDLRRLWEVGRDFEAARRVWTRFDVCPAVLASPASDAPGDQARRDAVHDRVAAYNAAMRRACDAYERCDHDDGAAFAYPFDARHLSRFDYFHPSVAGHNVLSRVTWDEGFDWS